MKVFTEYKKTILFTAMLCLLPVLFGVALWNRLPEMMPTHFNANNQPDGYMKKTVVVFILPVCIALLELLSVLILSIDPKKANVSGKSLRPFLWLMPATSWVASGATYSYALGRRMNISAAALLLLGLSFVAVGNNLTKNSQNYTVGVRTSWALDDPDNWSYTNRKAAISFTVCGIAVTVLGIFALGFSGAGWPHILSGILIAAGALYPVLCSYLYYKAHKKNDGEELK